MKGRLAAGVEKFAYVGRALQLIWAAARGWTIAWGLLLLLQGLLPAATVYLTKVLVDSLAAAIGDGISWDTIRPILLPGVLMAVVLLLGQVLQSLIGWVHTAQSELVRDHIKALVHGQASRVDLEFYDTPEYFDQMARANGEADSRSLSILQNIGNLLQHLTTLLAIAGLLIPYSVWLPFILLCSTLPALWVVVRHNLHHYAWWRETTEQRRWVRYYDEMLTARWSAPEVRLFGLSRYFQEAYSKLRRTLRESLLRLMRRQNAAGFGAGVMAFLVTAATMVWMVGRALRGFATIGDMALFYQAFNQGQGLMRTLLSSMGQLYTDALFLEHLYAFLDLESKVASPPHPVPAPRLLREGIAIESVTFRYPGSEQRALQDFNLFVPAGKTVAIVGPNGAGKSTLIKLLCRFYDPEEGSVKLDGLDIRTLSVEDLWGSITVLFQYPVPYSGTVAESIAMGDIDTEPEPPKLEAAAEAGGAQEIVARLPHGYQTILGKQFRGGVDLSGGQWQRIALARAFYRQASLVLLDEPTSFMDSWAETLWLDRLRVLVEGRTAIIVTHRFTTAMRADIICVMDQGRVLELGSHEELLERGGLYAASWVAQMRAEREVAPRDGN